MEDLTKVLFNLVEPMVDDPTSVSIKELPSLDDSEILLYVYAKSDDIARLIGRQGSMASALRKVMSIASYINDRRITIKFESY
ncbi:MAG: KH domain-containing protein [Erysipelotrichaceae bacterium]|nr:KH domain-containing protein [Erysipelotrichaceae bacterium]MDD4643117.1 KH domain-containing protein [Erysipelotrichaceae bacterium]